MDGAVVLNWGSDTIKAGQVSRFPSDNEPYVVRHGFAQLRPPASPHPFRHQRHRSLSRQAVSCFLNPCVAQQPEI